MIRRVDLHTHSTASDGQYTPAELAGLIKKRGTDVWALTDHDNLDGLEEAASVGEALGLRTSAVTTRLHRARAKLKERLTEVWQDE